MVARTRTSTRHTFPQPIEPSIYVKGKSISVYMPTEIYNQVLAKAREENRSLSNMVEVLCRRGLKRNPE